MKLGSASQKGKVVKLAGRRPENSEDASFGATISKNWETKEPANSKVLDIVDRIIIDESLPSYVASLDGSIINFNDHYRKLDKVFDDVSLAPGPSDAFGGIKIPSLTPVIDDVLASGTTVRAEEIAIINGRERIFLGRHMPVRNASGDIVAIAGTYEDVTVQVNGIEEANKTQARFQDFARASSDWFYECGPDLTIRSLSDRFTAIVGQPASLFIGSKFEQFGRMEKNLAGRSDGPEAIKSRKPFRDQLFIVNDPSGTELKFHLSAVPVFDRTTGEFTGYRGVGMDVSKRYVQAAEADAIRENLETLLAELTRKNHALDEATEQATSALRAKNEFLAAMSHELRTPLNAIIGFAEAFKYETFGELTPAYLDYAGDIHRSGIHLLGLINDILDVAVIESGGLSLQLEAMPVDELVNKAVQMNKEAAIKKNVNIDKAETEDTTEITVDDRRATQILVNLLSNAVKFTPAEGEIGIDVNKAKDKNFIDITVWDTGIGIAEEHHEFVFDRFHQVTDHIYSREQEGTGLGLHISRELARRMGGDITLTSEEGKGSRFTVTLPIAEEPKPNLDVI
ncbi:PAS domain-containing sensor histidine kinase [Kordiimonas sp. SCSIO 12610]|uniref:sensor histidine kinase n=1 Tax=Kordiimonas sp. SCSIO 12610 TaxID=2829597 RepID=UPI00210A8432|nr:PAS domain-containing sensor histidine kinase [Kordiimonas sp. SCSIO 12610]UTW56593.1 PAS domain-containing protein [Kordiimonas sp. SCSIO 12610]